MHTQVELCSVHHPTTAARSRAEALAKKLLDVAPPMSCSTILFDAKLAFLKTRFLFSFRAMLFLAHGMGVPSWSRKRFC